MSSIKDLTIYAFEAAWTDTFKEEEGFLPQASILPYVRALSDNAGCAVIYRQIRTESDFKTWSKAIRNTKDGVRIVWIAGHGEGKGEEYQIRMPDYRKTSHGNRLTPATIQEWLGNAGCINGVIVDSCNFGINAPDSWVPKNVMWALAYRSSVNWTESIFFGIKTIEWLYERSRHPKNGDEANTIFKRGLKTGGYQNKEDQFSLVEFGAALKAVFCYKKQGSPYWQTTEVDKLAK